MTTEKKRHYCFMNYTRRAEYIKDTPYQKLTVSVNINKCKPPKGCEVVWLYMAKELQPGYDFRRPLFPSDSHFAIT